MNARDIFDALAARHPTPEWVYLPQVRTRTGYSRTYGADLDSQRYLDAFAISCYPSHGFKRIGYEIKVSRSDWLRELEDSRKRAQGYFLCDEYWFALGPGVFQRGDEFSVTIRKRRYDNPLDGCGVIEVADDGSLTVERHATPHEAWPMPTTFVASLMRSYVAYVAQRQQTGDLDVLLPTAPLAALEASAIMTLPPSTLWNASGE